MFVEFEVSVGDIIFRADEAGKVCSCIREDGRLFALVKTLILVRPLSDHAASYRPCERVDVWRAEVVEQSLAWYPCADGLLTVLR